MDNPSGRPGVSMAQASAADAGMQEGQAETDFSNSGGEKSCESTSCLPPIEPPQPLAPVLAVPHASAPPAAAAIRQYDNYAPRLSGMCPCGRYEVLRNRIVCPSCKQGDRDPSRRARVHHTCLSETSEKYTSVKQAFLSKWYSQNRGVVRVERIIALFTPEVYSRYSAHQQAMITSRKDHFVNERRLFLEHYPKCKCDFADGGAPCDLPECELCTIVRSGVPRRPHGSTPPGSGAAVYLTYEPGDFTVGPDADAAEQMERELRARAGPGEVVEPVTYRRIGVAVRAVLGNVAYATNHNPSLTAAPGGRDSMLVEVTDGKAPEVVLHSPEAVLPTYIIVFQTGKIVV